MLLKFHSGCDKAHIHVDNPISFALAHEHNVEAAIQKLASHGQNISHPKLRQGTVRPDLLPPFGNNSGRQESFSLGKPMGDFEELLNERKQSQGPTSRQLIHLELTKLHRAKVRCNHN